MTATVQLKMDLWSQFTNIAQRQRKRPDRLLEKLIADYLAIQKDLQLDEALRQQTRKSGFKESDEVALVKQCHQF